MGLAAGGADSVARDLEPARLEPLLQFGLGVLAPAREIRGLDDLSEQPLHQAACRVEAAVLERRADQRLERVGEDRCALRAAAARLAFAEPQQLGQSELKRHPVQAVFADEVGADAGQIAFVGAAEALEQQARDDEAQDGIAEEFEALVVVGAVASVGQGPVQQTGVRETVADALLQGVNAVFHGSEQPGEACNEGRGAATSQSTSSFPRT